MCLGDVNFVAATRAFDLLGGAGHHTFFTFGSRVRLTGVTIGRSSGSAPSSISRMKLSWGFQFSEPSVSQVPRVMPARAREQREGNGHTGFEPETRVRAMEILQAGSFAAQPQRLAGYSPASMSRAMEAMTWGLSSR